MRKEKKNAIELATQEDSNFEDESSVEQKFAERNDIINSVVDIVEKSGISRIASSLEETIKECDINQKQSIILEKRLVDVKQKNSLKESELNEKTKILSEELEKFAEKAEIIKRKNDEYQERSRELKLKNIEFERDNVDEVEEFNEKVIQDSNIDEKFSKLNLMNKNLASMSNVDKTLTSELHFNIGNNDSDDDDFDDQEDKTLLSKATVIIED